MTVYLRAVTRDAEKTEVRRVVKTASRSRSSAIALIARSARKMEKMVECHQAETENDRWETGSDQKETKNVEEA